MKSNHYRVYGYSKCSTCRNALKFLDKHEVSYESIDITQQPPSKAELKKMLDQHLGGEIKKLFNTSGQQYRELKIKDKLNSMSVQDAISLLSGNGKLIKRPFLISDSFGTVGFKETEWSEHIN